MKNFVLLIVVLGAVNISAFAQNKEIKKRLKLTLEFGQALQQGTFSNEEIMKKYVAEGYYFKNDTVKNLADEYLNFMRGLKDYEIRAVKYSEHEDEFLVAGVRSLGDTSMAPHKLRFILSIAGSESKKKHSINIDDLYVIKIKGREKDEEGSWFILFNNENKIVSFAGMQIGDVVGLMQF